ncbi:MAG: hypothetical protein QME07_01725 [bacterium]|nr:hypothetical protein [bacterium]
MATFVQTAKNISYTIVRKGDYGDIGDKIYLPIFLIPISPLFTHL